MKRIILIFTVALVCWPAFALSSGKVSNISKLLYNPGELKPIDSQLKVKVGDMAPDFTLPSVGGEKVTLSDFRGKSNVVISYIPASWTPVCSGQWPGYNISLDTFKEYDAVLLGIAVDNVPSLHAWTKEMGGMKFNVLSDFFPHGKFADQLGILRSDGQGERALFFIDKSGVITSIMVSDINTRPPLEEVFKQLDTFK